MDNDKTDIFPELEHQDSNKKQVHKVWRWIDIKVKPIEYLIPGMLAKGMLTLVTGELEAGKSLFTLKVAADCSKGRNLPTESAAPNVNTLILAAEDGLGYTVKPRLLSMGVDTGKCIFLPEGTDISFSDPGNMVKLEEIVEQENIGLIVVDPLNSFMGDIEADKEKSVRKVLDSFVAMLVRTECAALAILHEGKSQDTSNALYKMLGSVAYGAVARFVVRVSAEENSETRLVKVIKNNIGRKQKQWKLYVGSSESGELLVRWDGIQESAIESKSENFKKKKFAELLLTDEFERNNNQASLPRVEQMSKHFHIGLTNFKNLRGPLGLSSDEIDGIIHWIRPIQP